MRETVHNGYYVLFNPISLVGMQLPEKYKENSPYFSTFPFNCPELLVGCRENYMSFYTRNIKASCDKK
jgi:hypothetical protein